MNHALLVATLLASLLAMVASAIAAVRHGRKRYVYLAMTIIAALFSVVYILALMEKPVMSMVGPMLAPLWLVITGLSLADARKFP